MMTRRSRLKQIVFRIFISLIAIWLLGKYSNQFAQYRRNMLEIQPLEKDKKHLIAENRNYRRQIDELNTPQGLKAEAHRQGYIEPGERRIVFQEPPAPKTPFPVAIEKKSPAISTRAREWIIKRL